ncbi:hypothetical protein [Marinomonas hwangdonensis]|nr:hypothetical protein [Marinomonas hwangdonensis]
MFGIRHMQKQRDRLYKRTQLLEKQAKVSRDKVLDSSLNKASSPEGLFASFLLGVSTQCDLTKKVRENLLSTASKDLVSFVITQFMAPSFTAEPTDKTQIDSYQAASATDGFSSLQEDEEKLKQNLYKKAQENVQ